MPFPHLTHLVYAVRVVLGLQAQGTELLVCCPSLSTGDVQVEAGVQLHPWFCGQALQVTARWRMFHSVKNNRRQRKGSYIHRQGVSSTLCQTQNNNNEKRTTSSTTTEKPFCSPSTTPPPKQGGGDINTHNKQVTHSQNHSTDMTL